MIREEMEKKDSKRWYFIRIRQKVRKTQKQKLNRNRHRQTNKQVGRYRDKQADRLTDRQADRQTDINGDREIWKVLVYDQACRDIISPLMNIGALRQKGVTLHMMVRKTFFIFTS